MNKMIGFRGAMSLIAAIGGGLLVGPASNARRVTAYNSGELATTSCRGLPLSR